MGPLSGIFDALMNRARSLVSLGGTKFLAFRGSIKERLGRRGIQESSNKYHKGRYGDFFFGVKVEYSSALLLSDSL